MSLTLRSPAAAVIGAFACILLNPAVVGFFSFTIFFTTLAKELGYGRGVMGLAITIGTLAAAAAAPIVGRLTDRRGSRRVILIGVPALAVLLCEMPTLCKSLIGLYFGFALVGILVAFYYVPLPRVIASWFDARRGLALGFVMAGTGAGSAIMSPIIASVTASAGWQTSYLVLAAGVAVISLPCALLFVHDPAGSVAGPATRDLQGEKPHITRQLLILALAYFFIGLSLDGMVINFFPMVTGRGISGAEAASLFSVASIAMFVGRIGCGYLLDMLPANRVGSVIIAGSGAGIAMLQFGNSTPQLMLGAVLFGLGVSTELDLISYIISRIYPIESFSRFFSFVYAFFMIGTSAGPPVLGGLYDWLGSNVIGSSVAAAAAVLAALSLAAMLPTPTHSMVMREVLE